MVDKSMSMTWYKGPYLLAALDDAKPPKLQGFYNICGIETLREPGPQAIPGDNTGFNVKNITVKNICRSFVAPDSKSNPVTGAALLTLKSS